MSECTSSLRLRAIANRKSIRDKKLWKMMIIALK